MRWLLAALQTHDRTSRGVLIDAALSCLVYLAPLVMPHALWPAGAYLLASTSGRTAGPGWIAMNWAAMLMLQVALFAIFRFARRWRLGARTLLIAVALIAAVPAVNLLLLAIIPLQLLVEDSTEPEVNSLTEVCAAEGVTLLPMLDTLHRHDAASVVAVRRGAEAGPALLRVSDCSLQDLEIPADAELGGVSRAGALVWRTREYARQEQGPWFLTTAAGETVESPFIVSEMSSPQPLDDGLSAAWPTGDPSRFVVAAEGSTREIQAEGALGTSFRIEGVGAAGPFYVSSTSGGETRWLTLDEAGRTIASITAPADLARFGHHLRPLQNGWIAWDTYREQGRYVLAWDVNGRRGMRTLPKGLTFNSIAFDDRGGHIAVSASSGLRIGSQRDEVWVMRTSDGAELYRRYAPKYARATVAMPTGRFFAVDELRDRKAAVRVYQLPR